MRYVRGVFLFTLLFMMWHGAQFCRAEDHELEKLRAAAQAELTAEDEATDNEVAFTSGALGLQALNPEISVVGDFLWKYDNSDDAEQKSDFIFRTLGLHLQAYLDPYTLFKAAIGFNEEEAELGEAYVTRFGIFPDVNLTLGKFRQQFGVVNRWHKHGLDQVDFPLALQDIFGPGGLNQTGASGEWSMPEVFGLSEALIVQVTDGSNDRVFGQNAKNNPSVLAHYKAFRDLTDSTYTELGLTVLSGKNNEWKMDGEEADAVVDKKLDAWVFGADFTVLWEPTDRMRYRNMTWRSEAYALKKDVLAPDGSGEDTIDAWGAYSYLESKVSRTVIIGVRGDYFVPDTKSYANSSALSLGPLAVTEEDAYRWQVVPYVTWYQSPFVHFRAEYDYQDGKGTGPEEQVVWLQCIFAAGPHKHDRY